MLTMAFLATLAPWRPRLPRKAAQHTLGLAVLAFALLLSSSSNLAASNFGINVHVPPPDVLDKVSQDGIGWIRIDFLWSVVQPAPNEWDWSIYDSLVAEAQNRGLQILGILKDTPSWATLGSPGTGVPDPVAWQRFCFRAARRYRHSINAWELWNEPNLPRFWEGSRQDYINVILLPGARAIHEADFAALAAGPALAHLQSGHWDTWLKECLTAGRDVLDVATHHLYPSSCSHTTVTKALDRGGSFPWNPPSVKKVLKKAGWFGRPFWLTETGMSSERCGQHDQAGFYTNLLNDWFRTDRDMSWMDRIFFYEIMDAPDDPGWGITGPLPELEPKEAYFAYGDFIAGTPVDDAETVAVRTRLTLAPGATGTLLLVLRNSGASTWTPDAGHRLVPVDDPDHLVAGPVSLPGGGAVPPGALVSLRVPVTAPNLPPGEELAAPLRFRMEREGKWRFGDEIHATVWISDLSGPWPGVDGPAAPPAVEPGATVRLQLQCDTTQELSFRWERDGVPLEENGVYSGVAGPELTIRQFGKNVEGWYRCVVGRGPVFEVDTPAVWVGLAEPGPPSPRPVRRRLTLPGDAGEMCPVAPADGTPPAGNAVRPFTRPIPPDDPVSLRSPG